MGDSIANDDQYDQRLAAGLVGIIEQARFRLTSEADALTTRITEHIGCTLSDIPNVTTTFEGWEQINVHRGVTAYLAEHDPDAEWFGISGQHAAHQDLMSLLMMARRMGMYELGPAAYLTVADGPDSAVDVVQFGLICTRSPGGAPIVIGIRGQHDFTPNQNCQIHVLAGDTATATATRTELERLVREEDAFAGQILQLDVNENRGNQLVSFVRRPELTADDVVLPDGVLAMVEEHVIRAGADADRLRAAGQHLKRGVLLYGPPGTGKTHTVRYLMSMLTKATIVVLSGRALTKLLPNAVSLARRAQPSVVVIEDVDLVAEDRSFTNGAVPMLFELLNRIDGVDGDADVTFLLTTNRVDALETALRERPGRVDLAVEIPRPDADCRGRLLRLYAAEAAPDLPVDTALVAATEGVTASFIRELVRRAVLAQLASTPVGEAVQITEADLLAALGELNDQSQALTRTILGGSRAAERQGPQRSAPLPSPWPGQCAP